MGPDPRLTAALEGLAGTVGLAVSGGSDSTALLCLAQRDLPVPRLRVATVDHGLRPEAAEEARGVARLCADLRIAHDILRWTGWDGRGNVMGRARDARYALLAEWARTNGIATVLLGHTADDLAEGVLLGLDRRAGLAGMAGMRPAFLRDGVTFRRPLLHRSRDDLRSVLTEAGLGWADDPTNDDPRHDRTRARAALRTLAGHGLPQGPIAQVARNLRGAEDTMRHLLADWAGRHCRAVPDAGAVEIDAAALRALPSEGGRRILDAAMRWVTGAPYPPRAEAQLAVLGLSRGQRTLHGCLIVADEAKYTVLREPARAVNAPEVQIGAVWDGRWRIDGPRCPGASVRALGPVEARGIADPHGLSHAAISSRPALWKNDILLSVPGLTPDAPWRATFVRDEFPHSIVSH